MLLYNTVFTYVTQLSLPTLILHSLNSKNFRLKSLYSLSDGLVTEHHLTSVAQIEGEISSKYKNRRVNIMGEINTI